MIVTLDDSEQSVQNQTVHGKQSGYSFYTGGSQSHSSFVRQLSALSFIFNYMFCEDYLGPNIISKSHVPDNKKESKMIQKQCTW